MGKNREGTGDAADGCIQTSKRFHFRLFVHFGNALFKTSDLEGAIRMQEVVLSILIFIHQVGSCVGGWFDSGENPYEALRSYGGIATIELTVRDDQGLPVEDAEAKAFFDLPFNEVSLDVGKTDTQGRVTLSEEAIYNNGSVSISKDGYYNTDVRVKLVAPNQPFGFFGRRRWKTEILTVTLKKKAKSNGIVRSRELMLGGRAV